ncbi:MAG: phosphonate C-P lyase system protein PhnG [Alphaproteobacteria bacterium]
MEQTQPSQTVRQRWMSILARATPDELEKFWETSPHRCELKIIRKPEVGMIMVKGKVGGTGSKFNIGEMTVTRCSVQLGSGTVGHCYRPGRDLESAKIAAAFDALMQEKDAAESLEKAVIQPIELRLKNQKVKRRSLTEATKVDFFTLVRGED